MWFRSILDSANSASVGTSRRSKTRRPQRRPEALEDRSLLSAAAVVQTNLVSDNTQFTPAQAQDPNLVNPWGLAASPTGDWWVANQGTGTSTLYDTASSLASVNSLVVNIPANTSGSVLAAPHSPTGTVYNGGGGFDLVTGDPSTSSLFLFATVDGTISGWNPSVNRTQAISKATSSSAVYTGLAIATDSQGDTQLYSATATTL